MDTPPAIVPAPVSGSAHYLTLAQSALNAATAGALPADEAVHAAEAYARMAGAETPEAKRFLGEVYLRHRDRALSLGNVEGEQLFGALAMFRLDQAADAGDEQAGITLTRAHVSPAAIVAARSWAAESHDATVAQEDRVCAAAGAGDELALNIMLDEVFAALADGTRTRRDALLLAFAIARVGDNFSIASIKRRLAGILICLGEMDREGGNVAGSLLYELAALLRLAEACLGGDAEAASRLPETVEALPLAALYAAKLHPTILALIAPVGDCQ